MTHEFWPISTRRCLSLRDHHVVIHVFEDPPSGPASPERPPTPATKSELFSFEAAKPIAAAAGGVGRSAAAVAVVVSR